MSEITINYNKNTGVEIIIKSAYELADSLSDGESAAMAKIFTALSKIGVDCETIKLQRRSKNYLSLIAFEIYDFIRIKIGSQSLWFSICLSEFDKSELKNDIRLETIENKNQVHWKIPLADLEEISLYEDLFQRSYQTALISYEYNQSNPGYTERDKPLSSTFLYKPNGDIYKLNNNELLFNQEILKQGYKLYPGAEFSFRFMDKNVLNYSLNDRQLGRIKLKGRKLTMQLDNPFRWLAIADVQEAISYIPQWIKPNKK